MCFYLIEMKPVSASFNCKNFAVIASIEHATVVGVPHEVLGALAALVKAQLRVIYE